MRIFAAWDIPAELRNELVQLLNEFFSAHPGCKLEIFMENTPTVTPAAFLAEPAAPVAPHHGPSGPQLSPLERAIAAVRAHPMQGARSLARQIGVSHQTIMRAKAALPRETAPALVQGRSHGPRGPKRHR